MDWKLLTTIYAAIVATAAFFWNVYIYFNNTKGKIKIEFNCYTQQVAAENNSVVISKVLLLTLTNAGNTDRHITKPYLIIERDNKKYEYFFYDKELRYSYPLLIPSGEMKELSIRIRFLFDEIKDKIQNAASLQVIVKDTKGAKYKSKRLNVSKIELI